MRVVLLLLAVGCHGDGWKWKNTTIENEPTEASPPTKSPTPTGSTSKPPLPPMQRVSQPCNGPHAARLHIQTGWSNLTAHVFDVCERIELSLATRSQARVSQLDVELSRVHRERVGKDIVIECTVRMRMATPNGPQLASGAAKVQIADPSNVQLATTECAAAVTQDMMERRVP